MGSWTFAEVLDDAAQDAWDHGECFVSEWLYCEEQRNAIAFSCTASAIDVNIYDHFIERAIRRAKVRSVAINNLIRQSIGGGVTGEPR